MKYLYEMHTHTSEVSHCGSISAAETVKLYSEKGYNGLVVTDHFYKPRKEAEPLTKSEWNNFIDKHLLGYQEAKNAAPKGFSVLLGLEIRFNVTDNDYLVYGVSEELLRKNIGLYNTTPRKFKKFCDEHDLMFYQAHPFRNYMSITPPAYLHGIETGNYNQRHDSRNDIAELWAEKYQLRKLSGSDFHEYEDLALGGIYTDVPIENNDDLVKILESSNYSLKKAANPMPVRR